MNRPVQINWSDKVVTTVIAAVDTPQPPVNFPGFFATSFPDRCWDEKGRVLVLSTQWGSFQDVTVVQTESAKVTRIYDESKKGAWLVLDVSCDLVLAQFSNPNTLPQLVMVVHFCSDLMLRKQCCIGAVCWLHSETRGQRSNQLDTHW